MNALLTMLLLSQVPYDIEGEVVQVVKGAPFAVVMQGDADLYFWQVPKGLTAIEQGKRLQVTKAAAGEHKIRVKIISIDWAAKKVSQTDQVIAIRVGVQPDPEPDDPPPVPPGPVPPDRFDNVGQQAAQWAASLKSKALAGKLAQTWQGVADELERGQIASIGQAVAAIKERNNSVLTQQADRAEWQGWGAKVNQVWSKHWPLDRSGVVEFYRAVAGGLQNVK